MHCRFVLWNISRKIFSLNGPCWKFAFQWHCNAQCCSSMLLLLLLLLRAQWFYGQQNFLSSGQIWVATCNASSTTVDLLCGANATGGRNTLEIVWSLFDFHDLYWAQQWSGHLDSSSSIQPPPLLQSRSLQPLSCSQMSPHTDWQLRRQLLSVTNLHQHGLGASWTSQIGIFLSFLNTEERLKMQSSFVFWCIVINICNHKSSTY